MGDGKDPAKVLDIKTADIKRAAPDFQTAAVDLGKALTALVKSLDGLDEPWGNDKQGKEFGGSYKPLAPQSIPDVREWTAAVGGGTDYLDYLSQEAGLGEWAAFSRVFMPRFVEVDGCVLWDRVYEPDNFRSWQEQLGGDATSVEAMLNQLRLWLYIDIPDDHESEAASLALAADIAVSWRRSLADAFPDRAFEVAATDSEDGPIVSFVTVR